MEASMEAVETYVETPTPSVGKLPWNSTNKNISAGGACLNPPPKSAGTNRMEDFLLAR